MLFAPNRAHNLAIGPQLIWIRDFRDDHERVWDYSTLTNAAGYAAVPLGQSVGYSQALDGTGSLQDVSCIALKTHHGSHRKVVPSAPAVSGLWDWAALCRTGSWDS